MPSSHIQAPLPTIQDDNDSDYVINWDDVAKNYHQYILSPFAPEMLEQLDLLQTRNLLVNTINGLNQDDVKELDILDLGCGPGNFIQALNVVPKSLTGVDLSGAALALAEERAQRRGINFIAKKADIRTLKLERQYDVVVSVNSVLPKTRQDVVQILQSIKYALKPNGIFYVILPSFDTTQYLRQLWFKHFCEKYGDRQRAEQNLMQFDRSKLIDPRHCLYADDGLNQQAYHTPETISDEFKHVGLDIIQPIKKVYYPWELARRFDYGYFPDADEEIWDWYVVARNRYPTSENKISNNQNR